jgi:Clp amino terminal domain, pathogenicity island component
LFERFTTRARRSIFVARYEASALGTTQITAEELLLGVLREDKFVAARVGLDALLAIRKELEQLASPKGEHVPTSVDMAVSHETRRALEFATEEADALQHKMIDTPHLVLGLLRVEGCLAATLLRKHGLEYDSYRTSVQEAVEDAVSEKPPVTSATTTPLGRVAEDLRNLVDNTRERLQPRKDDGEQLLKRKPWKRIEALGHLIDWAMAHQQWLVEALAESKVKAAGYPDESTAAIKRYADFDWPEAVELWVSLNRLLVHVLAGLPEDKADVLCRIGIADPVPLAKLMNAYVEHCQDIVGQILARLE